MAAANQTSQHKLYMEDVKDFFIKFSGSPSDNLAAMTARITDLAESARQRGDVATYDHVFTAVRDQGARAAGGTRARALPNWTLFIPLG
jgi:hypothetical protein